jgi:DNA polymerase-3 subunit alpha
MGKKDINVLKKLEEKFVEGAWSNHQFDRDKCKKMWEAILGFASYCFNKSHSACYGLIAYWTAYVKANHFAAFMTANLIYEMDNKDKMTKFVEELREQEVPVLPPDINESGWEFTLVKGGDGRQAIRFGFGGVKAVGEGAAQSLIAERGAHGRFESLYDLCARVDTRAVNKRVVESLVKVGALDSLHPNRHALFDSMDKAFERGNRMAKNKAENQQTLFATFDADDQFRSASQGYPDIADWTESERLAFEKAATGYWISSHPLAEYQSVLSGIATHRAAQLVEVATKSTVSVAAVVLAKRVIRTKTGKTMAVLTLEDQTGRFEGVLFPGGGRRGNEAGPYDKFAAECEPDLVALFTGAVERRERRSAAPATAPAAEEDGEVAPPEHEDGAVAAEAAPEALPSLIISDCIPARLVTERLTREIHLAIDLADLTVVEGRRRIAEMETLIRENPGPCPLTAQVHTPDDVLLTLAFGDGWKVHPNHTVLGRLRAIWGDSQVRQVTEGRLADGAGGGTNSYFQ